MTDGMDQDENEVPDDLLGEKSRIVTNIRRRITTRKTRRKVNEMGYDKVKEKNKEKKDEDWTSTGPPVLGTGRICLL